MRIKLLLLELVVGVALSACGGDDDGPLGVGGSTGVAGSTGSEGGGGAASAGPVAPALVDWTCPPGWEAEAVLAGSPEEISICVPPALPENCPDGTMPVIGQSTCQFIGDPCPAGDWPEGLPAGTIVYVKEGGTGDGSSTSSPLGSIETAVDSAPAGAVVAVAKGTYSEMVSITEDVTLWGACATAVTLDPPSGPSDVATIDIAGSSTATLRNLTVTGPRPGLAVRPGSTMVVSGVRVLSSAVTGISVLGRIEATNMLVEGTTLDASGTSGHGVDVLDGEGTITASVLFGNRGLGVGMWGGTLELTDVLVQDTLGQGDGTFGFGIGVSEGALVTIARTVVTGNRRTGLAVLDGSQVDVTDSVVASTQGQESDLDMGYGIAVGSGGTLTGQQIVVEANRTAGIGAFDASQVELADVVLRDNLPREADQRFGAGMGVFGGATVTLTRAVIDGNTASGIEAGEAGTSLELVDSVVRGTLSQAADQDEGFGIVLGKGVTGNMTRTLIEGCRTFGLLAANAGTVVGLTDVAVTGTLPSDSDGRWGAGVALLDGAQATLTSCRLADNRVAGALIASGAAVTMSSSEIVATSEGSFSGAVPGGMSMAQQGAGDGIAVVGASALLDEVRISGCARAGVLFSDSSGNLVRVVSEQNAIGLALQGNPRPTYDPATCDFSGSATPIDENGAFPVPQ